MCGFRSQYNIHSSFQNNGEGVDGDWIGGYRSHTRTYPSDKTGGLGRLLGLSVYGH